jgi:hypothetical protein
MVSMSSPPINVTSEGKSLAGMWLRRPCALAVGVQEPSKVVNRRTAGHLCSLVEPRGQYRVKV